MYVHVHDVCIGNDLRTSKRNSEHAQTDDDDGARTQRKTFFSSTILSHCRIVRTRQLRRAARLANEYVSFTHATTTNASNSGLLNVQKRLNTYFHW